MKSIPLFILVMVTIIYFSCGGSDTAEVATRVRLPGEDGNRPQPESNLSKANCTAPNLKLDINLNRKFCGTDDCLLEFKGFWWWTNYQFTGPPNYFYNQGQGWSPRNVFVDGEGLHLKVRRDDLGGGIKWTAAEVCAVYKGTKNTLANMGYGTYLVSAKIKTADSWNKLDKNVAFGVFTYQRDSTWSDNNPYRELDLAEISRWGTPPCKNVSDPKLCTGNAQFAIQRWGRDPDNVQRYTINEGVKEITLVMKWVNGNTPVIFKQYNGTFTLANLPQSANNSYTTKNTQNKFIPEDGCQLFHINLWLGNYGEGKEHPGPTNNQDQEVVVTNFQYAP